MTFVLKAFIVNAAFVDNTVDTTAPFGELAPISLTFSTEVGSYVSTTAAGLTLVSFTSQNAGVNTVLDASLKDRVMTICEWIYNQTTAQGGQMYADQLLTQLLAQFNATANTFTCGNIIASTLTAGTYYIPEWVAWTDVSTGSTIKIWFVDASFQAQYDDFTLVVVPPITPLANFFTGYAKVLTYINAVTYPTQIANIETAKAGKPPTFIKALTFSYIDPTNSANTISTNWTVLGYGPMGDNVDSLNNAISTYCLANSTYTQTQWAAILPDIFLQTEFVFIPLWDQYAIPDESVELGVYSPQAKLSRITTLVTTTLPSYAATHIDSYLNLVSYPYKSLQMAVIGSVNNKNSWYELIDVFPDLITVSSTSTDFARMSLVTQTFAISLGAMLLAAESMTATSDIPTGYTRVTRDNQLYIVLNYQNIHYLVAAKQDLTTVITGVTATAST